MTVVQASARGQLAGLQQEVVDIKIRLEDLLQGLSDPDFNRRPPEGGWSVGECLEHLNVMGRAYLVKMDEALERAKVQNLRGGGGYRFGLLGGMFIDSIEPPVKLKLKAPVAWQPPSRLEQALARADFIALQDALLLRFTQAEGYDLNRIRLTSPLTRFLRFNLYEAFALVLAHERRHLEQGEQVKALLR